MKLCIIWPFIGVIQKKKKEIFSSINLVSKTDLILPHLFNNWIGISSKQSRPQILVTICKLYVSSFRTSFWAVKLMKGKIKRQVLTEKHQWFVEFLPWDTVEPWCLTPSNICLWTYLITRVSIIGDSFFCFGVLLQLGFYKVKMSMQICLFIADWVVKQWTKQAGKSLFFRSVKS